MNHLQIDATALPVTVRVEITNTGDTKGDEVVQLYLQDAESSVPMPVKQLKGFKRVTLEPAASTLVEFSLTQDDLSFYDENSKSYVMENGVFNVLVGNAAVNIVLTGSFTY